MSVKLVLLPFRIYPIFRPFNGTVSIYGFSPRELSIHKTQTLILHFLTGEKHFTADLPVRNR